MDFNNNKVILRCDDGAEAAVFTKYNFYSNKTNNGFSYEFCIEDDYTGGDYKGFFGRLKRAWRAFCSKPVIYTGIYTDNKSKMRNFLAECLKLIDEEDVKHIKTLYDELKGYGQYDQEA